MKTKKKISILLTTVISITYFSVFSQTSEKNHLHTTLVKVPEKQTLQEVEQLADAYKNENIVYINGTGRTIQQAQKGYSPNTKDFIAFHVFDEYGQQERVYSPYADKSQNDGSFKTDVLTDQRDFYHEAMKVAHTDSAFSFQLYEHSPMNRVFRKGYPGYQWSDRGENGHTTRSDFRTNISSEVRLWEYDKATWNCTSGASDYYDSQTLSVAEVKDENDHKILEFKDKAGKVILKRSKLGGQNLDTYYVYDNKNNLVCVIPPKAMAIMSTPPASYNTNLLSEDLVFKYKYDQRQRMIEKKIPGQETIYYVYDKLNRVVLTQDGNLRDDDNWLFTKYDILGRPVITGLHFDGSQSTRIQKQTYTDGYVDGSTTFYYEKMSDNTDYTNQSVPPVDASDHILTVTYYDHYDFTTGMAHLQFHEPTDREFMTDTYDATSRVIGKETGSRVKTLEQDVNQRRFLYSVNYYDDYGRVIQTISEHYLEGYDIVFNKYDFSGNITVSKLYHYVNAGDPVNEVIDSMKWSYDYDHAYRLTHVYHSINDQAMELIVRNKYNELGELIEKNLHAIDGDEANGFWQSIDYRYNTRGWLTQINSSNLANDNMFIGNDIPIDESDRVSGMIITEVNMDITEETGDPGRNIVHVDMDDIKDVISADLADPNDTTWHDADEVLMLDYHEELDSERDEYNILKDLDGESFSFDLSSIKIDEYAEIAYIRYQIDSIVEQVLLSENITDTSVQDVIKKIAKTHVNGKVGIVYFNEDTDDLYGMDLLYEWGFEELGADELYNGNISGMRWQVKSAENRVRGYGFRYDDINRLTHALYAERPNYDWDEGIDKHSVTGGPENTEGIHYDENGNIEALFRKGMNSGTPSNPGFGFIDKLVYSYDGNRLTNVEDYQTDLTFTSNDFRDNNTTTGTEYQYDDNGNMISDANKNIQNIVYNYMNLPIEIDFGDGNKIEYIYDALGNKHKKEVWASSDQNNPIAEKYYAGSFVYNASGLEYALFDEGRLTPQGDGTYRYEYFFKDHLGNTRVVFTDIREQGLTILQESHYYPFGMEFMGTPSATMTVENFYKYNGKELQSDGFDLDSDASGILESRLLWYDYGARFYDAQLGRFPSVDPIIEKFPYLTPFNYASNNPITKVDLWGLQGVDFYELGPINQQLSLKHTGKRIPTIQDAVKHSEKPEKRAQINALAAAGTMGLGEVGGAAVLGWKPLQRLYNKAKNFFTKMLNASDEAGTVVDDVANVSSNQKSGGRLGGEQHRSRVGEVADKLVDQDYEIIGGGNRLKEEYLPGNTPGTTKGSNYVDVTAIKDSKTIRVQVGKETKGGQPVSRERVKLDEIQKKKPNDELRFEPYNK